MKDFKKGDVVIFEEDSHTRFERGDLLLITEVLDNSSLIFAKKIADVNIANSRDFAMKNRKLKPVPIDNALNRKLYPNWKEYNGYLLPAESGAKLNEEKK